MMLRNLTGTSKWRYRARRRVGGRAASQEVVWNRGIWRCLRRDGIKRSSPSSNMAVAAAAAGASTSVPLHPLQLWNHGALPLLLRNPAHAECPSTNLRSEAAPRGAFAAILKAEAEVGAAAAFMAAEAAVEIGGVTTARRRVWVRS